MYIIHNIIRVYVGTVVDDRFKSRDAQIIALLENSRCPENRLTYYYSYKLYVQYTRIIISKLCKIFSLICQMSAYMICIMVNKYLCSNVEFNKE